MARGPLPYREPVYESTDELVEWIKEEMAKRRADLRPIEDGEIVEAMLLGAGPDNWTCVVRGPKKAFLGNDEIKKDGFRDGFPGGIVTAYVDSIDDDAIYLTRWVP